MLSGRLFALAAALALVATPVLAVGPPPPATATSLTRVHGAAKIQRLRGLADRIAELDAQLKTLDSAMHDRPGRVDKRAADRLEAQHQRLDRTRASFQSLAAHENLARLRRAPKVLERDLLAELRELMAPVIDGFRRISARPRLIEGLRAETQGLKQRIARSERAQIIVMHLLDDHRGGNLERELKRTAMQLRTVTDELKLELSDVVQRLESERSTDTSMLDSATSAVSGFLTTKGRNILLAVLVWLMVALGLMSLRPRLFPVDRLQQGRFAWLRKPLSALYGALVFLAACGSALLCLYLLSDMLLFTLAILVLSFIVWSTRQMVPLFIREARLVLNLGPVREGERIIWRGLPWRVAKLGLRPLLENPALTGGQVRVRATMLLDDVSRPAADDEPWFPTATGDWVLLRDRAWGRVALQTPDQVIVAVSGVQERTYSTVEYLAQRPTNLSRGFFRRIALPVAAHHQADVARLRELLAESLREAFADQLSASPPVIEKITVVALSPTPFGLRIEVQLVCTGAAAAQWRSLGFTVNERYVALCNAQGWSLPRQASLPRHASLPHEARLAEPQQGEGSSSMDDARSSGDDDLPDE